MSNKEVSIKIFGKKDCSVCKMAKAQIVAFLSDFREADAPTTIYYDLDTLEGLTEAASACALDIPTIIVEENSIEIKRWSKKLPGEELKNIIGRK